MSIRYNIERDRDENGDKVITSISVFGGSEPYVVTPKHVNFVAFVDAVESGEVSDEEIKRLYDVGLALNDKFERLSDRVTANNGRLFVDGTELKGSLAERIINFMRQNLDFGFLVQFLENLSTNPDSRSRESLFEYLETHRFSLTDRGTFIAYKGVNNGYFSTTSGEAIVDDVIVKGYIPNKIGSVIRMDRSQVTNNPNEGCAQGLHVATFSFADVWATRILMVEVHPRDVVSVPTGEVDKMRVCQYTIIKEVTIEDTSELIVLDPNSVVSAPANTLTIEPKVKAKSKKKAKQKTVKYDNTIAKQLYADFRREDFDDLTYSDFKEIAKEFGETKVMARDRKEITDRLVRRTRDWRRG